MALERHAIGDELDSSPFGKRDRAPELMRGKARVALERHAIGDELDSSPFGKRDRAPELMRGKARVALERHAIGHEFHASPIAIGPADRYRHHSNGYVSRPEAGLR